MLTQAKNHTNSYIKTIISVVSTAQEGTESLLVCVTKAVYHQDRAPWLKEWLVSCYDLNVPLMNWRFAASEWIFLCFFPLVSSCPVSVVSISSPRAVWLASLSLGLSRALQSSWDSIPVLHSLRLWLPQPAYSEAANYVSRCVCASVWPERSPMCWPRVLAWASLCLLSKYCRWSPERDQVERDGWCFC